MKKKRGEMSGRRVVQKRPSVPAAELTPKICAVIITRYETKDTVLRTVASLSRLGRSLHAVIVVCDRRVNPIGHNDVVLALNESGTSCSPDDVFVLNTPNSTLPPNMRNTATARNLGLRVAWDAMPDLTHVLFLDGDRAVVRWDDRYICDPLVSGVTMLLPVLCDHRSPALVELSRGQINNGFYAAGVLMPALTITSVVTAYHQLWPEEYQGKWGFEDVVLGDRLSHLGIPYYLADSHFIVVAGRFTRTQYDTPDDMIARREIYYNER